MSEKEMLLRKISAESFAMWELRLFIDTHPNSEKALKAMEEHQKRYDELVNIYESKYGPLVTTSNSQKSKMLWLNGPWPWEYEKEGN